jgi:hypothetical protein
VVFPKALCQKFINEVLVHIIRQDLDQVYLHINGRLAEYDLSLQAKVVLEKPMQIYSDQKVTKRGKHNARLSFKKKKEKKHKA